jgi:hypothetical protein
MLNLLLDWFHQPRRMLLPSLVWHVQLPYRRPCCEQTGDHLCEHPELTRIRVLTSGTVAREAGR